MKNHEAYEEGKLYPYLHARYGLDSESLRHQHRLLGTADETVRSAHGTQDALQVVDAFKQHDKILVSHLAHEEDLVIPLLLEMPSAEFRRYSDGNIHGLLKALRAKH